MKKLDLNQMENIEGGKFWGRTYTWSDGHCYITYDIFWITVSEDNTLVPEELCNEGLYAR